MRAAVLAGVACLTLFAADASARGGTNPNRQGTGPAFALSTGAAPGAAERNIVVSGMTQPGFLFVTHVWNYAVTSLSAPVPVGTGDRRLDNGLYFTRPVSVLFNPAIVGFKMRADDGSVLPSDVAYNVHYEPIASQIAFIHRAASVSGNFTVIDHPLTNGRPNAQPQVLAYSAPVSNPHHVGVFYTGTRWAIFNQDMAPMPPGVQFNVLVSATGTAVATARATNISANSVYLDDLPPNVRSNPKARLLVTQLWRGVYNDHEVGVWFDRSRSKWAIYNEDRAPMSVGTTFHVDWDLQSVLTGG